MPQPCNRERAERLARSSRPPCCICTGSPRSIVMRAASLYGSETRRMVSSPLRRYCFSRFITSVSEAAEYTRLFCKVYLFFHLGRVPRPFSHVKFSIVTGGDMFYQPACAGIVRTTNTRVKSPCEGAARIASGGG